MRPRATVTEGRLGVPMDIAKGILFLASDDAGYMNGAGLIVDCGLTHQDIRITECVATSAAATAEP